MTGRGVRCCCRTNASLTSKILSISASHALLPMGHVRSFSTSFGELISLKYVSIDRKESWIAIWFCRYCIVDAIKFWIFLEFSVNEWMPQLSNSHSQYYLERKFDKLFQLSRSRFLFLDWIGMHARFSFYKFSDCSHTFNQNFLILVLFQLCQLPNEHARVGGQSRLSWWWEKIFRGCTVWPRKEFFQS